MVTVKEILEIVVPIYNEENCIHELVKRLFLLRDTLSEVLDVSFIFINDGSRDKSLEILLPYVESYAFVKLISFSRNFGHQMAVTAGVDHAKGDYVAIIDADLQDPPELIEEMYKKAKEGYDIVYGKRLTRKGETVFKRMTAKMFYLLINKMCDIKIPDDTGDFRLLTKKVVQSLNRMREQHRFIRGMVPWLGFKSAPILYNRNERYAGNTKYPFKKMMRFALNGILSFSTTPLKMATYLGLFTVTLGILGGMFLLYLKYFRNISVPGITATISTILIMSGIQIIILGTIGEYLGRIFEESKNRPLYIVEEMKNFPPKKG